MHTKIISLIATVYNEEDTIESFLESILNQEILPDEIIIVDGGSTDKTFDILQEYSSKYNNLIKIYKFDGANIAQGRNYAIKQSSGIIIVTTDAGCVYDANYVREIIKPLLKYLLKHYEKFGFKKEDILEYIKSKGFKLEEIENSEDAEFVQGKYYPYYKSDFEYFTGLMLVKNNQCRIPSRASARATAYFKYVWEAVRGYPEKFVTGEDTLFNYRILERGFKWVCVDTKVYWKMPKNIREFYKKFERYAVGDVIQGNIIRNKKILFLILLFYSFIAVIILAVLENFLHYLIYVGIITIALYLTFIFHKYRNLKTTFYLTSLNFVRIAAYIIGTTTAFLKFYLIKIKISNKK